ncbi:STAS domain-containing protein [Nocardioides ganghwensis]|nr:STAS domain-containing protein [Nocardioides ganghwensis]MBD3946170.1 STAS domain-containing protein [Nocardioides ganghwensis]
MSDRSGPPPPSPSHDAVERDARLALRGLCDARAAARHRARVRELLQHGPSALVVDLGRPRRLSSETVGLLLWLHRACLERGVRIVVTGPPRRGVDPLWRSGVLAVASGRGPGGDLHAPPGPIPPRPASSRPPHVSA